MVMGLARHPGMGPSVAGKKPERGPGMSGAARAILRRHIEHRRELSGLRGWRHRRAATATAAATTAASATTPA